MTSRFEFHAARMPRPQASPVGGKRVAAAFGRQAIWLALIGVVMLATVARLALNADMPYLWFDEAGQYFIAKGLNHDSPPLSAPQGLAQVIENNRHYNRDPGGFSVALHAWSAFGDGHVLLRWLPFSLYLLSVAALVRLLYVWSSDLPAAMLGGLLPMFSHIEQLAAFELRAYSMEMLGTVLGLLAVETLRRHTTVPRLLAASAVLSVFMTSRYSAILVMFAVSLYVFGMIATQPVRPAEKAVRMLAWGLPMGLMVAGIYFVSMVHQNAGAKPLHYLPYLSNDPGLLLKPKSLFFLGVMAALAVLLRFRARFGFVRTLEPLFWILLLTNAVFMITSAAGMHPWDPFSDRCVSLHFMLVILGGAALSMTLSRLRERAWLRGALIAAALVVVALSFERLSFYGPQVPNVYSVLASGRVDPASRFYVDRSESPSIRYLFEHGALRGDQRFDYPAKFTFGTFRKHSDWAAGGDAYSIEEYYRDRPKMNELTGFDVMIAPELYKFGNNDRWQPLADADRFFVPAPGVR